MGNFIPTLLKVNETESTKIKTINANFSLLTTVLLQKEPAKLNRIGMGGGGTVGTIPKIGPTARSLEDSIITESGSTISIAGNLSLGTGELTCGSINRATGTLTLEIAGGAELSITSTRATFTQNVTINGALTMGDNIIMADNSITGIDTLTFTDVNGTIAGIENQNLLDKTAAESITGLHNFIASGVGGLTDYDLKVGDTDGTPTYGMIQMGNSVIGRTSYNVGNIDLDGTIMVRNIGGPVTSDIEFIWTESAGNTCRFALPKSAVGNATYNSRSMLLAGPAPADTDFVKVSYWQGQGIFHNLPCDTVGSGADLGVQGKIECEDIIFCDNFKESTTAARITFGHSIIIPNAGNIGSVSDTDAIQIEADGDVVLTQKLGIGATPTAGGQLDCRGTGLFGDQTSSVSSSEFLQISRNGDAIMSFRNLNAGSVNNRGYMNFRFKDNGGTERICASLRAVQTATHASQPPAELQFWTAAPGVASAERVTIDSSGYVHILANQIHDSGGLVVTFDGSQNATLAGSLTMGNHDITVNTSAFFVDASTARIGIGTAAPNNELDVYGQIQVRNSASSTVGQIFLGGDVLSDDRYIKGFGQHFFLGSSFHFIEFEGIHTATIESNAPDGATGLQLRVRTAHTSGNLIEFEEGTTPYAVFDHGGNFGVGTTTPGVNIGGGTADTTGKVLEIENTGGNANIVIDGDAALLILADRGGAANDKSMLYTVNGGLANFTSLNDDGTGRVAGIISMDMGTGAVALAGALDVAGGLQANLVTKTGAYTATASDYTIICDASSAAFTITLPAAASHTDRIYHIKKIDSSSNTVTVDGNGSEPIDDATTAVLTTQYESITIQSTGSEWWIL